MSYQKNAFNAQEFLRHLTSQAGIYQMFGENDEILYVGKARNLKKRVASYFRQSGLSIKTNALIQQVQRIEVIVTHTETEALLLENNLIKQHKPRYNILLRDDKSYPYIVLTEHADYPRLDFYRGTKRGKARYFGPYPSTIAVRETLNLLQKLFHIRQCEDNFFRNRSRPCLQYQIKRCSAPCVAYIDAENYQHDIKNAILFLEGKSQTIIENLVQRMDAAAHDLNYELAAKYRDQITYLRQIQQQQAVNTQENDIDVIGVVIRAGSACIQIMTIRGGRLLGGRAFFPRIPATANETEILSAFLTQHYLNQENSPEIPRLIVLPGKIPDQELLGKILAQQTGHKVYLHNPQSGERLRWLALAQQNAENSLASNLAEYSTIHQRFKALQTVLDLPQIPQRIECFDISHSSGEAAVASCVVFDQHGPRKSDYRRFNINDITPGDDYAAMQQALTRRYLAVKTDEGILPDIVMIDGGKGQLKKAQEVFAELQISNVLLLGIAKGPSRKAGLETLFLIKESQTLVLPSDSTALHLLQQIRDEAHRFAIVGHRGRRAKRRQTSPLEEIPGIGAKRRRELLRQFGGWQELRRASVEALSKVPGISRTMAQKIYAALRDK